MRHFKVISVVLAALEPYQNLIQELFDSGQTYAEISAALQSSGAPRCSVMAMRRFCMEQNGMWGEKSLMWLIYYG